MDPTLSILPAPERFEALDASWRAIAVGFLIEKGRRTDSRRTTEVYGRTVGRFLDTIGDPAVATPLDVHRFAYGLRPDGFPPSPSTVSLRLAAVSGFFDFAKRMEAIERNPAANVRRPQSRPAPPRGLTLAEVTRLLDVIPATPAGLLDRAIILTAVLTGLRRAELFAMRLIGSEPCEAARYEVRVKGGRLRRRELPDAALHAILVAATARGIGCSDSRVFPISDSTFYAHLRRYGEAAGIGRVTPHSLRHSAARLRRQTGATIEEVSALLGHRSIATTAGYLDELEDERDDGWGPVALALGFDQRRNATGNQMAITRSGSPWSIHPAKQGGRANSRPATWTGGQLYAPLPGRDLIPERGLGGVPSRRTGARRTRRRRAPRSRRTGPKGDLSALRRSPRSLDGRLALEGPLRQRCR